MNRLVRRVVDLIYPPKCMLCHQILENSLSLTCGHCEEKLPYHTGTDRKVPMYEKAVAAFYYEEPIRSAILRYKFQGVRIYETQFAAWMAAEIREHLEGTYDLISWVPCSAIRRYQRGFDQSQRLALALSKELGCPVLRTLKKRKHNKKQSKTKHAAQRRANVLGVYGPYHPENYIGKRILMVDDILTTGATLSECGKTLRLAGSGDLVCAVIAVARREKNE